MQKLPHGEDLGAVDAAQAKHALVPVVLILYILSVLFMGSVAWGRRPLPSS